jgi:hypothetical protein
LIPLETLFFKGLHVGLEKFGGHSYFCL